jgi:hypothetical protein
MALPILDGNQSATTLATTISGGAHYPNHIIASAVTISSLPAISGAVTIGAGTAQIGSVTASISGTVPISISSVTIGNSVTISSLPVQLSTTTIGGTARLNVTLSSATTIGATAPSYGNLYGGSDGTNLRAISVDTSGRTVVTGAVNVNKNNSDLNFTAVTSFQFSSASNSPTFSLSNATTGQTIYFNGGFAGSTNNVYSLQHGTDTGSSFVGVVTIPVYEFNSLTTSTTFSNTNGLYFQFLPNYNSQFRFSKISGTAGTSITASIFSVNQANYNFANPVTFSAVTGSVSILGTPSVTMGAISGTVTVGVLPSLTTSTDFIDVGAQIAEGINNFSTIPVAVNWQDAIQGLGGLSVNATCVTSTNRIGAVTIYAQPSGALTTRFGSVTTANTAQITTAVTNTSRKYLLAQNISTGTVTIGIGFSPTTTQGIQLTAGAGLTFDSFVPTGAVYWLGATTGAAYTILEG